MAITASHIDRTLYCTAMRILSLPAYTLKGHTNPDPSSENIPATGRVKPNSIVATAVMIAPPTMNGRRLPNLDFELSASTPVLVV